MRHRNASTPLALLLLPLLGSISLQASALESALSYDYVQGSFSSTRSEPRNADGWNVNASAAIHPNWHLFGSYAYQDYDSFRSEGINLGRSTDTWQFGAGYNLAIATSTDLVARLAYQRRKEKANGLIVYRNPDGSYTKPALTQNHFSYGGWVAEVGARTAFNPTFEGYAFAGYENYGRVKFGYYRTNIDNFYGRLGVNAKFNQNWSATGEVQLIQGGTQVWSIGPRFSW